MNSSIVNFETIGELRMKSQHESNENQRIELENGIILRQINNVVYTTGRTYRYRIKATKRRKVEEFNTLPFGHC